MIVLLRGLVYQDTGRWKRLELTKTHTTKTQAFTKDCGSGSGSGIQHTSLQDTRHHCHDRYRISPRVCNMPFVTKVVNLTIVDFELAKLEEGANFSIQAGAWA